MPRPSRPNRYPSGQGSRVRSAPRSSAPARSRRPVEGAHGGHPERRLDQRRNPSASGGSRGHASTGCCARGVPGSAGVVPVAESGPDEDDGPAGQGDDLGAMRMLSGRQAGTRTRGAWRCCEGSHSALQESVSSRRPRSRCRVLVAPLHNHRHFPRPCPANPVGGAGSAGDRSLTPPRVTFGSRWWPRSRRA